MAYPDVLNLLRDHLATAHTPTPVGTRVPAPRPTSFIQLRLVGGNQIRPVRDSARFDIFTWAATEETAATLARAVRLTVHQLAGGTTLGIACYRVDEFLAPRQFDDPVAGAFRWWQTQTLTVRANDAIAP